MGATNGSNGYLSMADARGFVQQAVFAAHTAQGYIRGDGRKDSSKIRRCMLDIIHAPGIVTAKNQRAKLCTRRENLTGGTYDQLPGPTDWDDQPNPRLAEETWRQVDKDLWGETKPDFDSELQKMIADELGNGFVLCRYKVGMSDAVYITSDPVCIQVDFLRLDNESAERKLERVTGNRVMVVQRLPQHGKLFMKDYDKRLTAALEQGKDRLQLAYESVTTKANTPAHDSTAHGPAGHQAGPVVDDDADDDDTGDEE